MVIQDQASKRLASEDADSFSTMLSSAASVCGRDAFTLGSKRALRLVSKSSKNIIESLFANLYCRGESNKQEIYKEYPTLRQAIASKWDMSGIKALTVNSTYSDTDNTKLLLDLPLESLESLTPYEPLCCSLLADANWPCLKSLFLNFDSYPVAYEDSPEGKYYSEGTELAQLRNVTWPLKTLSIVATDYFEADSFDLSPAMEMLHAFPELAYLRIEVMTGYAHSIVRKMVQAPLLHLESLTFENRDYYVQGIPSVLATANWP